MKADMWSTSAITKVCVDRAKMKRAVATGAVYIWTDEERRDFQTI